MSEPLTKQYRIDPEPFWAALQWRGETGYDSMGPARGYGWHPIGAWGSKGWDLGSWPLVIIYFRNAVDSTMTSRPIIGYDLCEYVEGDAYVSRFPTRELRDAATDELAFFHWKHQNEDWVEGFETVADAPACLKGPYSSKRSDIGAAS